MAPSSDLWNKAVESLSEHDKLLVDLSRTDKAAILEDIVVAAEAKRQTCLQNRWKYQPADGNAVIVRDVCEKLIRWVRTFKEIGDIAVQYDPAHASLPWAAVRFLLQLSISDMQMFGAMAESLETCSRFITRCKIIELLYLQENLVAVKNLEDTLVRLYAAILKMLSKALRYYKGSSLQRAGRSILQTSENPTDKYLSAITNGYSQVESWCSLIDADRQQRVLVSGTALHSSVNSINTAVHNLSLNTEANQVKASQDLMKILASLEQPLQRVLNTALEVQDGLARTQRLEVLRWMSSVPYREHHKSFISDVLDDSGIWMQNHSQFVEWKTSSSSSILWLHGIPGCGKTKLVSIVIESLLKEKTPNSAPLAYFYCARDASEPQRADPEEALRAIVKQLSCPDSTRPIKQALLKEYQTRKLDAEEDGLEPSKLTAKNSIELILALTDQTPATIVIDALDECEPTRRYELLNALHAIVKQSSSIVKILVSSREDADMVSLLRHSPNIQVSAHENSDDIQRFVHAQVQQAIHDRRLLNGELSPQLQGHIITKLNEGANGMFRWASLQIQTLCDPQRMKIASDVELALHRLPRTLSELYSLILEQVRRTEPEGRSIAENALQWLLCARVTLSVEQMIELVSRPSKLLYRDDTSANMISAMDILSLCCNLVVEDRELNCFRFAHVSVRDFLNSCPGFDNDTTHLMAVRKCLDIYDIAPFDNYPTALDEVQRWPCFEYAARYWIVHYKNLDIKFRSTVLGEKIKNFFVKGSEINQSFEPWMLYARDSAAGLDPYDPLIDSFLDILAIPASPLFTGCTFGLLEILRELQHVETLDWHQRNQLSATGIHIAARHGHADIIEFLLRKAVDVNSKTDWGETALHRAVQHGNLLCAKLLLAERARVTEENDEGFTALDIAMQRQDEEIILLLLQNGAKDEALAKYGEKVSSWNNRRSHGTLRLLNDLYRPTGYIGILNEGQTGYLNTVLQLLFMLRPVHQVISSADPRGEESATWTVARALRQLFSTMATTNDIVSARELTEAFGWASQDLDVPHDPLESLLVLLDYLEDISPSDNFGQKFNFTTKYATRFERQSRITVNATGNAHLYDGIRELSDSYKDYDIKFLHLPPILTIEIRRFMYNMKKDQMEKIHSYFEFPATLTLNTDLQLDVDDTSSLHYILHGVIVHRGDFKGAKSFVFLKPQKNGRWLKFRNNHISFATTKEAIDDNFGSDESLTKLSTSCTAHGLIYLQEDSLDELLQST